MKIPILILSLTASALHAGTVFQENFEYGPGVPDREQIREGTPLKQSGMIAGENPWQVSGFGAPAVILAPGRGLTINGADGNVSILIEVDPELFADGSPVRAELEVVPGDLWHGNPGVPGIWLGFANRKSKKDELLANINELADHLALRYAVTPDPLNCFPAIETGVSGEIRTIVQAKKKVAFQPGTTYRMTLVFNPADRGYEATILDTKSGETQTITGTLALPPVFNVLRVDFTSMGPPSASTKPLIKSLSLTKE